MSYTSVIRYVRALDSTATDGSGKISLAFGDITAKYLVKGGTLTSLTTETITTLGTYQAPTSAAHIRIKELTGADPTKGIYEVHFHDTQMVSTGVKLWLFLSATGAAFAPLEVDLTDIVKATDSSGAALATAARQPKKRIWHVAGSGGDYTTIADAITAAAEGDDIYVDAGSFAGGDFSAKDGITIRGAGRGATSITTLLNCGSGCLLCDFSMSIAAETPAINAENMTGIHIERVKIVSVSDQIIITTCDSVVMRDVTMNSTWDGLSLAGSTNVYLDNVYSGTDGSYDAATAVHALTLPLTGTIRNSRFVATRAISTNVGTIAATGTATSLILDNVLIQAVKSHASGTGTVTGLALTGSNIVLKGVSFVTSNAGSGAVLDIANTSSTILDIGSKYSATSGTAPVKLQADNRDGDAIPDMADTVDGVSHTQLYRALIAMLCGKCVVTDNGATRTLSFKQQNGSTESFTVTLAEADGTRSSTGSIT